MRRDEVESGSSSFTIPLTITKTRRRRGRLPRPSVRRGPQFDWLESRNLPSTLSINNAFVNEGNSGTTDAIFTVFLDQATTQTITVDFFTADGTARAPSDYLSLSGTLTFAPGDTSKTIAIEVNGDGIDESDETFSVRLNNAVNATVTDSEGIGTIRDDDSSTLPALSVNNASVIEGALGTTDAVFTVFLSQASSQTVSVTFSTANSTAFAPSDYVEQNRILNFASGVTSQTVSVPVSGDTLDELDEVFFVNLSGPSNATIGDGQGEGTIRDDDDATSNPSLSVNNASVREGATGTVDAVFTVSLSQASAQNVSVAFTTADGTARAPSDYQFRSGSIDFAPGETTKTIAVSVNGDTLDEFDESFFLNLSDPSNAIIGDNQGVGTIQDDDPSTLVTISISDAKVTESDTGVANAVFTVALSGSSSNTITVRFATADRTATAGDDYDTQSGTLTFTPGETTESIVVPILGDTLSEGTETFVVDLTNPLNATIADSQGVGTITDNDSTPTISIVDTAVVEGNSGSTNARFNVVLSGTSTQSISVDFTTVGGTATSATDFSPVAGRLTFDPGQTSSIIDVPVFGDRTDEVDETFFVNLSAASNATLGDSQATGTIRDDDGTASSVGIFISDVATPEGNSGTTNAVFTVALTRSSTQATTVAFATAAGSATSPADFIAQSGTLTFQPGESSRSITVTVQGDTLDENNETYLVNLISATNASITDSQAIGTIIDDDSTTVSGTSISISDVTVAEGNSGNASAVFDVSLDDSSTSTVTVDFFASDGSAQAGVDYVAQGGRLTFQPGVTMQRISIVVNGDTVDEFDEVFFVNLTNATNGTISDNQGTGVIVDNDSATSSPSLSINSVVIAEGNSGTRNALFTVSLSTASTQTVQVNFATSDLSATAHDDYAATNGTLTFAPGSRTQTIAVPIRGDTLTEVNEQFQVNLSNAINATITSSQGIGTITNDDGSPLPGSARCTVSQSGGSLRILCDDSANFVQIDDNGNGSIYVTTNSGINESFGGIVSVQVLAQGGDDDVRFRVNGTSAPVRFVEIDLGVGDDDSIYQAAGLQLQQNMQVRIRGGAGSDSISAAVDAVLARSKTVLDFLMDGGAGSDTVDTSVHLSGAAARGSIRVAGDDDNDSLSLSVDAGPSLARRLRTQIDGGNAIDTCTAFGAVNVRRC